MLLRQTLAVLAAAVLLAPVSAFAEGTMISVQDPYARASTAMSKSGAAFMTIVNSGAEDDRLVSARAPVAERVELHTHRSDGDGVMRMIEVEEGFAIPAGGSHALARGGDHVMFMGLTEPLTQGKRFPLTLVFEKAGEITLDVTVDLERAPGGHGMKDGHGMMKHGQRN